MIEFDIEKFDINSSLNIVYLDMRTLRNVVLSHVKFMGILFY